MTRYFLIATLILFAGYGLIKADLLLTGPVLSIAVPQNDASFPGGVVRVSGTVTNAALLTLDGEPLPHDQNGDFSTVLTFPHGGSILTFVATDRLGKTATKVRTVFVP